MKDVRTPPKITFGIIVLNGEPFVRYCLRALYPFAHEIIVVEGATEHAKAISTPDGHSLDTTLESIRAFIRDEDPEKKVRLITKDGYWQEKGEMSAAYASACTGDYLWQIDIDEFYLEKDMKRVSALLEDDPTITGISFLMKSFWGGIGYREESPAFGDIYRVFKFGKGYRYVDHRPPTVIDDQGIDQRSMHWIDGSQMRRLGIYMYHYGFIFPAQVSTKATYYESIFKGDFPAWAENNYFRLGDPFHVNDNFWRISWLTRYKGPHPAQVVRMMEDIKAGRIRMETRPREDIERLLRSPYYAAATWALRGYYGLRFWVKMSLKRLLVRLRLREHI